MALLTNVKSDTGYGVPPGSVFPFSGVVAPPGWLLCDGSARSRTVYANLFNVLSPSQTCNTNNLSTTVTVQDSSVLFPGMVVHGVGIPHTPTPARIATIVNATSVTLTLAATATQTGVTLRFGGSGFGDWNGTTGTTFNVPDFRGRFIRGWASGSTNDPDRATRSVMAAGGSIGDNIGSTQVSQYGSHSHTVNSHSHGNGNHNHTFTGDTKLLNGNGGLLINTLAVGDVNQQPAYGTYTPSGTISQATNIISAEGPGTDSQGGLESRPLNAYLNYIIKT